MQLITCFQILYNKKLYFLMNLFDISQDKSILFILEMNKDQKRWNDWKTGIVFSKKKLYVTNGFYIRVN